MSFLDLDLENGRFPSRSSAIRSAFPPMAGLHEEQKKFIVPD